MRKDGLLARLRGLKKNLPCSLRELGVVQRLNVQRWDANERKQLLRERRGVAVGGVQLLKNYTCRAHPQRKNTHAPARHPPPVPLLLVVIHQSQTQPPAIPRSLPFP